MHILLTGAAGFIGYHSAEALLARGDRVTGVDNLTPYYDLRLKRARLDNLCRHPGFRFVEADCADETAFSSIANRSGPDAILHLAAQAGVRYSVEKPLAYVDANVRGQVVVLEQAARLGLPLVFASSSSVYGANDKVPFEEDDRVDSPVSVYAATKRAGELMATAYASIHGVRSTGLRFFTVYGPWGRPDMAPWLFTDAIRAGRPIEVFNNGDMERDFTHVTDIVAGVTAAVDRAADRSLPLAPVYNLGNNTPVRLMDFIAAIERAVGREAIKVMRPKPAGDVLRTFAGIGLAERDLGYRPKTGINEGIADFVAWFRTWQN
ncbi:UDP-glucuronate 4-epimerase [Hoeflea marina]|uniref:UDP-glucuronate 4-epimerase n=1 Tax=Hoeflea marina TaxID=274592 RepID=A0A317PMV9_9HYPH|nr:NAD-dependent epimerase/dehydratase family protein [Hoeflea marina]PWW02275.1 UDP-glucuronate 4-epimerase [Hoeflea marina]